MQQLTQDVLLFSPLPMLGLSIQYHWEQLLQEGNTEAQLKKALAATQVHTFMSALLQPVLTAAQVKHVQP